MSTDRVLANIDAALQDVAAANARRFDLVAGGVFLPGSTPGVESARWVPSAHTAVGLGWVSPPGVRYEPVEQSAAPVEAACDRCAVECPHGALCLDGHGDTHDHWYSCGWCTSAAVEPAVDVHQRSHHLDPDRECARCRRAMGWDVPVAVPPPLSRADLGPWWDAVSSRPQSHRAPGRLSSLFARLRGSGAAS